jgi:aryl-alcohol dehydrogenase-like predicted oxidoreductase
MRYQLFGRSGLRVSELCLGTMTFGNSAWGTPESEAKEMYRRFRDMGGNYVDTANEMYAEGRSEEIVGRLISGHRHEVVVATKYTFAMPGGRNPNAGGNHRKSLLRSLEGSLKRLNMDYVDVMWIHAWDPATPSDELMRALDDAVRQGKILHIGASNTPAWVVSQCNMLADMRGWTPFAGLQVEYSLVERGVEREILPMAKHLNLSVAAWSPLGSGLLSGKYANPSGNEPKRLDSVALKTIDGHNSAIAAAVGLLAAEIGRSSPQVALNWLRAKPGVIPLVGARTLAQFDDNFGCLNFELTSEQLERLDAISALPLGYPHDFLQKTRAIANAGFQDKLDLRKPQ